MVTWSINRQVASSWAVSRLCESVTSDWLNHAHSVLVSLTSNVSKLVTVSSLRSADSVSLHQHQTTPHQHRVRPPTALDYTSTFHSLTDLLTQRSHVHNYTAHEIIHQCKQLSEVKLRSRFRTTAKCIDNQTASHALLPHDSVHKSLLTLIINWFDTNDWQNWSVSLSRFPLWKLLRIV